VHAAVPIPAGAAPTTRRPAVATPAATSTTTAFRLGYGQPTEAGTTALEAKKEIANDSEERPDWTGKSEEPPSDDEWGMWRSQGPGQPVQVKQEEDENKHHEHHAEPPVHRPRLGFISATSSSSSGRQADTSHLLRPQQPAKTRTEGKRLVFNSGAYKGQPIQYDEQWGKWVPEQRTKEEPPPDHFESAVVKEEPDEDEQQLDEQPPTAPQRR